MPSYDLCAGCARTRYRDRPLLALTLHKVYLALAKTPIEGPGGVEATFDFRPAYNARPPAC